MPLTEDETDRIGATTRRCGRAPPPSYVFLASQVSSYMTSEVLGVTGGSPIT